MSEASNEHPSGHRTRDRLAAAKRRDRWAGERRCEERERGPARSATGRRRLFASALLPCLVAGCGAAGDSGAEHRVERETRGDTTIVRTLAGGVWGGAGRLEEELRIGRLEGPEEEVFGRVTFVTPDGAGGVYVFDQQAVTLRHFDAEGRYTHTIGRAGEGPGEYRQVYGVARRSDDRIVVYDLGNARINVYEPDGTVVDHWPVEPSLATANALTIDAADHLYIRMMMEAPEPNRVWRIGLFHIGTDGVLIDTIPDPTFPGEPELEPGTFDARKVWTRSPQGPVIVGLTDALSFDMRHADGSVTRVERAAEPVAFLPEERAGWEARNEWIRRNQGEFLMSEIPPVPAFKPAYRSLLADADGRVWVRRFVRGQPDSTAVPSPNAAPPSGWTEPVVYDLFEPDGEYLGPLQLPPRTTITPAPGDEIWGIVRGDFDEPHVVRFRLVPPSP